MSSGFRSSIWDPWLIISQIIFIQCLFYFSSGFVLSVLLLLFTRSVPRLDYMFTDRYMNFSDPIGICLFTTSLVTPLLCSIGLWLLVKRSKQCLDFSCTVYLWHFIFCILYSKTFPQSITWWLVNSVSIGILTVMGEFLCMRTELRLIPVGSSIMT